MADEITNDRAIRWEDLDPLIHAALEEDAACCDVTTGPLVAPDRAAQARIIAREDGIVCGLPVAERVAHRFDQGIRFGALLEDGASVTGGATVADLAGPAASILTVERTMLNFLQRLSGIATLTARYVEAAAGTGARILDTRKTTPGWRRLDKYAVRCGGGLNHRMDLSDAALIKDNHLVLARPTTDGAGEVCAAIEKVRAAHPDLMIEVEVEDMAQLARAVDARPDVILLDNMTPDEFRRAVEYVRRECTAEVRPELEASGGITLANVRDFAEAGADRIAVGALTHSAPALDLSLELVT